MDQQYVGIDLHRRRSVIVRLDDEGEKVSTVKINNDPVSLSLALAEAGPDPEVVVEASYGCTGRRPCSRRRAPECSWCTPPGCIGLLGG